MIKKLLLSLVLVSMTVCAHAQGTIKFPTDIKVYDDNGSPLTGNSYYAQIYAADGVQTDDSTLVAKGTPFNFGTGTRAGYATPSIPGQDTVIVSPTPGWVTLQLRAWDSTYATYGLASAMGGKCGKSNLITVYIANSLPVNTIGFYTFDISSPLVSPEPSAVALGVLGLSTLLVGRRRHLR